MKLLLALLVVSAMADMTTCLKQCRDSLMTGVDCVNKCARLYGNNKAARSAANEKTHSFAKRNEKNNAVEFMKREMEREERQENEEKREQDLMHQEEKKDEDETNTIEHEMVSVEHEVQEERKKAAAMKAAFDKEQQQIAREEAKLRQEREHLIEVERDEARIRIKTHELQHPLKVVPHHDGPLTHREIKKIETVHMVENFGCLHACLLSKHNAVACHKQCTKVVNTPLHSAPGHSTLHTAQMTTAAPVRTHPPGGKCKNTSPHAVSNCYGAQLHPNQCCDTCEEVQAAYLARNWAVPTLDHFWQCKGQVKAQSHTVAKATSHDRIFRSQVSKKQHDVNKMIHKRLFKNLDRHTETVAHFPARQLPKNNLKNMVQLNEQVRKWETYRLHKLAMLHPKLVPTVHPNNKASKAAPKKPVFVHPQMLKMSKANMGKWAALKAHQWMAPHKVETIKKEGGVHKYVMEKHNMIKHLKERLGKRIRI